MPVCSKCGSVIPDGANFCRSCGTPVIQQPPQPKVCPSCGNPIANDTKFCSFCGARFSADQSTPISPVPPILLEPAIPGPAANDDSDDATALLDTEMFPNRYAPVPPPIQPVPTKTSKSFPKKALLIGGISLGALVFVVLAVLLILHFAGGSKPEPVLYVKAGEIVSADPTARRPKPAQITADLDNGEGISNTEIAESVYVLSAYVAYSEDGKRMFYPDRIDEDEGITLYMRETGNSRKDPVMIDSGIRTYAISPDGSSVIYIKGQGGSLFVHDLKEKVKIAEGVSSLFAAEDFSKFAYYTFSGDCFTMDETHVPVKFVSNADSFKHMSDDLTTVYFTLGDTLYKQVEGEGEKVKIADAVSDIVNIYPTGEIYFTRTENHTSTLMDYVDDDLAEADAAIKEPEEPEYPEEPKEPELPEDDAEISEEMLVELEEAFKAYEEALLAYEEERTRMETEYEQACELYAEKLIRDFMREELLNAPYEYETYSLHYYDGFTEYTVSDSLTNEWDVSCSYDAPVITASIKDQSDAVCVKFSELESTMQIYDLLYNTTVDTASDLCVAIGSSLSFISDANSTYFNISPDGSLIYFLDNLDETGSTGDLYTVYIAEGRIGTPVLHDTGVSSRGISFGKDTRLMYFKHVDQDAMSGDLYIDAQAIDYDVALYRFGYSGDLLLYYTNYSSDCGTLKSYDGVESVVIADYVHDYSFAADGLMLYLSDYDADHGTGTLYRLDDGKVEVFDDGVTAILSNYDRGIYGRNY